MKLKVQLTWSTWNEVCEFVPDDQFVRGVYLDENGYPLPEGKSRWAHDAIGLILRGPDGREFVAREWDWLMKDENGQVVVKRWVN